MQAARPRRNKPANRLTGLEVALQKFAARMIFGSGIAHHSAPVPRHPQKAATHRDAAGVVRLRIDFMEHLSGPVHQIGALRYFLGDPQTSAVFSRPLGCPSGDRKSLTTAFGFAYRDIRLRATLFLRLGHSRDGESCCGQAEKIPSSRE